MEQRRAPDFVASTSRQANPLAFVLLVYFFANAVAAVIVHGRPRTEVAAVFVVAVIASQALLLVMWVGLGNAMILLRLLCALSWCLWMTLLGSGALRWELEVLATIGLMLLLAAAPFGLLKVLGFRIVRRRRRLDVRWRRDLLQGDVIKESREASGQIEDFPELMEVHRFPTASMQFSIVQIFGWTALAGVMAVLARIAGMGLEAAVPMAISLSIATAFGLTTLWAVLGADHVGLRMLAPFAIVLLITLVAAAFEGRGPGEVVVVVFSSLALATAAVSGVLGLFRSAGFRVRRSAALARNIGDSSAATRSSATNPWDEESP
ncbi:MAG TPA: hypothetical protein VJ809_02615 [Pirellulales bacterium]|nr:hypothetical protein [Pirellulales bacterium]